jgi:hypothetical protein
LTEAFNPFINAAFQLNTNQPLHLTHAALFDINLGGQLGQLGKLLSWKMIKLDEACKVIEEKDIGVAEKNAQLQLLDVVGNPNLLASRVKFPTNILLPILVVDSRHMNFVFISPNLLPLEKKRSKNVSVKMSRLKAENSFKNLWK